MNFDAVLNVTGMLVICGFRLGFRKELKNGCKHLLMLKKRRTTVTTAKGASDTSGHKGASGGSDASEYCPYRDSDMSSVACD